MTQIENWKVIFSGRVQGVGFRYSILTLSKQFEVAGFVQNLNDGSVKLVCEGKAMELEAFVESIKLERNSNIHHQSIEKSSSSGQFQDFSIRR